MMGAVLAKYLPGRTFHLSVCWPTQRQVYSCPEPGERWCRGYTQSLPSSPLRLCGISLLVFSLCFLGSARGEKKNVPHYCVTKHLTISFSTTFLTCVTISWDKTLFPLFIIMLVNLLKDVTINMSCAYVAKGALVPVEIWEIVLFYLRTGSLKNELVTPMGADLMGLSIFSSSSFLSSALSSVSDLL